MPGVSRISGLSPKPGVSYESKGVSKNTGVSNGGSGGSGPTFHILTESGDPLATEAGPRLETEAGP
jgi:hypothetical protein